jgi:hypothetical protein
LARASCSSRSSEYCGRRGTADVDALEGQERLSDCPALIESANHVGLRHAHILEEDFAELLVTRDIADRTYRNAGRFRVNEAKS